MMAFDAGFVFGFSRTVKTFIVCDAGFYQGMAIKASRIIYLFTEVVALRTLLNAFELFVGRCQVAR